jgi:hypothetical protein
MRWIPRRRGEIWAGKTGYKEVGMIEVKITTRAIVGCKKSVSFDAGIENEKMSRGGMASLRVPSHYREDTMAAMGEVRGLP